MTIPEHLKDRRIGLMGVDLVKSRIRNTHKVYAIINPFLNNFLRENGYYESTPFKWVGLVWRYGMKNDLVPEYQRINKKYGDLPIAIELKAEILMWADQNNLKLLEEILMIATLEALIHVAKKYKLPTEPLEKERTKYAAIPESIEDCEAWSSN